jgi:hypothetical protein
VTQGGHSCNVTYEYNIQLPILNTSSSDEESDSDFEVVSVQTDHVGSTEHLRNTDDESSSSQYSSDDESTPVSPDLLHADLPQDSMCEIGLSAHSRIKIESSVRTALGAKKAPLLKFFKPCTPEEYDANLAREQEVMHRDREGDETLARVAKEQQLLGKRLKAKLRQRKHRHKQNEQDIIAGIRSPGGTKRKLVPAELIDSGLLKRCRMELAEETRPARLLERKIKEKKRKPQGRKAKHMPRQAKYHNWFSPVCWRMIEEAAKAAGWKMSATQIVKIAKARYPMIFEGLARETVREWIDRSGPQPRWSDSTLLKIKAGNTPGHPNGGPRGILVSCIFVVNKQTNSRNPVQLPSCCHENKRVFV